MARTHSTAWLRAQCMELRVALRHPTKPLASDDEVRGAWPGGRENRHRGLAGWIECYAQLRSYMRRIELQSTTHDEISTRLEQTVRAAASRQPVHVRLSIGDRYVYQKSAWALHYLEGLDALTRPMADFAAWLEAQPDVGLRDLVSYPSLASGLAWRTWAWILLHEGVELPFGDADAIEPPEWTMQLVYEDHLAIFAAHHHLHCDQVREMALAMREGESGERSRLSLSGFLAGYGNEHGIRPSELLRRWGYPESIAAALAAFESHRVAEANAKAKADKGR